MEEVLKNSIAHNSGMSGDPEKEGVSVWHGEDENDLLAMASRALNRNKAKSNLDKLIQEKIEGLSIERSEDNIDAVLERIAEERKLARESFSSNHVRTSTRKKQKRKLDEAQADRRLDVFLDKNLARLKFKRPESIVELTRLIVEKEALLSKKMAHCVDLVDIFLDKNLDKSYRYAKAASIFARLKKAELKEFLYNKRRPIIASIAGFAVMIGSFSLALDDVMAYEYMYNGKVLGTVKEVDDVYDTIDAIGDKLACAYDAEISICSDKDISFRKVAKLGRELDTKDDILDRFTYMNDMTATAYAIMVNGQQKALLHSREDAQAILDAISASYTKEIAGTEYETVGFAERVDIKEFDTKLGYMQNEDEVLEYMLTGAVEVRTYAVKSGDTFNQIAKNLNMTVSELAETNPDVNPARLQIGQELVLNRVRPVLTVQTTEIREYIADIDYDISYEESSALYTGETSVKRSGVKGEKQVVARVIRNNGEEISREELSAKIISEPKDQIVIKGTKALPPLIGTGKLIYPVRGRLTSRFGMRWGRMHNGIDLANSPGTKIRAADGGVVVSAGWEGALGYCIRIDHGQNRTTVYGHCSKLLVKRGDKVYQDQHIGNVGNTGNSTGPHLHFEVHVNGVPQNPLKYLN